MKARQLQADPITAVTWPGYCDLRETYTEFELVADEERGTIRCLVCGMVIDAAFQGVPND